MLTPPDTVVSSPAAVRASRRAGRAIVLAGLVAGTLDLLFAWVVFPRPLVGTLKLVAGGWFGPNAGRSGAGVAAIGFASHFLVALGAAAGYWIMTRVWPGLNRFAVVAGLVYGLVVYEAMHLIVLPLSAYHRPAQFASLLNVDVLSHLFFVGLPIALIIRHYSVLRPARPLSAREK